MESIIKMKKSMGVTAWKVKHLQTVGGQTHQESKRTLIFRLALVKSSLFLNLVSYLTTRNRKVDKNCKCPN
jgi:hypothetical protein